MKLLTVIGARPQFIKAAVVSRALREAGAGGGPGEAAGELLVHTGQHFDPGMSDVFFAELEIPPPRVHLGIGGSSHGHMTGRMLEALEEVILEQQPAWVLVYGDTNSTLAGALAAAKLHVPVAHVEAGLRSFNRRMPEEINRVVTDHVADLLLAPTETAVRNLEREGLPAERIHQVGDVMYDALLFYREKSRRESTVLDELGLEPRGYVLATVHRAENTDDGARLRGVVDGLSRVAAKLPVVLPLHPRTRKALEREGLFRSAARCLRLLEPLGYLDMVRLESEAALVATDSGGVQKEAYLNGVPCVTLRDETEWVELVETGANLLAGTDPRRIEEAAAAMLGREPTRKPLYGQGNAGEKIAALLLGAGIGRAGPA